MQVVHARCCGLDVHQKTVVACVLLTEADGRVSKQVRTFGAMTPDLLALNDWLGALAVERVALESTGVYTLPTMLLKPWLGGSMPSRSRARAFIQVTQGQRAGEERDAPKGQC